MYNMKIIFRLHTMLFLHNKYFSTYSNLDNYSVNGYLVLVICEENIIYSQLKHGEISCTLDI